MDGQALGGEAAALLRSLVQRYAGAVTMLLAHAIPSAPAVDAGTVPWTRVVRRPISIADLVAALTEELEQDLAAR